MWSGGQKDNWFELKILMPLLKWKYTEFFRKALMCKMHVQAFSYLRYAVHVRISTVHAIFLYEEKVMLKFSCQLIRRGRVGK